MVMFPRHPTVHTQMLCLSPLNLPSTLKLSRLACSVCEYLKVLPEDENEAGISPSRNVAKYPGGIKCLPENKAKVNT